VTNIPYAFRKKEKLAIPKIEITIVALYICVRAGVCVCVCVCEPFVVHDRPKNF
jgi:hypothetical protein